jgi:hypothetical protein
MYQKMGNVEGVLSTTEWVVEPEKLMDVLSILDLVPSRPGIPASVFIKLEETNGKASLMLSSDVTGVVHLAGKGTLGTKKPIYLDRRLFFPFILTAKTYKSDKPFVFTKVEKQIKVNQGRRKASFDMIASSTGYGEMTDGIKGTVLPIEKKISGLITIACACSTSDPTVPELNCVYVKRTEKGIALYASNQLVVFKAVQKVQGSFPEKLPFPLFLIPIISNDRIKEVRLKEKEVTLTFDCGQIWQGVSAKASKGFPIKTMNDLLETGKEWTEQFRLQTKRLGAVTTRFSDYLTSIRRQDWLLTVSAKQGDKQVLLEVKIPQGIFREFVPIEKPAKQDIMVGWPLEVLLPIFTHLAKDKEAVLSVRFDKKTPYLLTAGGISAVVTKRKN